MSRTCKTVEIFVLAKLTENVQTQHEVMCMHKHETTALLLGLC